MNAFLDDVKTDQFKENLMEALPNESLKQKVLEIYKKYEEKKSPKRLGFLLVQELHPEFRLNLILKGPYKAIWESSMFHNNNMSLSSGSLNTLGNGVKSFHQTLQWFQGNDRYFVPFHSDFFQNILPTNLSKVPQDFPVLVFETEKILEKNKLKQYCHSSVRIACWCTHVKSPELSFEEEKEIMSLFQKIKVSINGQIPNKFILYKLLEHCGLCPKERRVLVGKSKTVTHRHDAKWKLVCESLDIPFLKTL